jgi:hypothetical protein
MKFDENGNRVVSQILNKTHHVDGVYFGLESAHPGVSDATMNVALDMVHDDRVNDFHFCLKQMEAALK